MKRKNDIKLVGLDLTKFEIVQMTEVYRVDDYGQKGTSIGFFSNPDIAMAFVDVQAFAKWYRTGQAMLLTDGDVGYVITQQDPVKIFNDKGDVIKIKKKILDKLTHAERKILNLK